MERLIKSKKITFMIIAIMLLQVILPIATILKETDLSNNSNAANVVSVCGKTMYIESNIYDLGRRYRNSCRSSGCHGWK